MHNKHSESSQVWKKWRKMFLIYFYMYFLSMQC